MRALLSLCCAAALALCACNRGGGSQQSGKNVQATVGKEQIAPDTGGRQVTGRVATTSPNEITLDSGAPNRLKVDSQTTIVLDGQHATATDLPAGTDIRASYSLDQQGTAHATSIEARTMRGTGENAATPRGQPKVQ